MRDEMDLCPLGHEPTSQCSAHCGEKQLKHSTVMQPSKRTTFAGATIVAIRRGLSYIVSPGPYAELYAGDAVIFVGGVKAREAVSHFFANP